MEPLRIVLVLVVLCVQSTAALAESWFELYDTSIRARVSDETTLGKPAPEEFEAYDIAAHFSLPWLKYDVGTWHTGTGMMLSGGFIAGADEHAVIVSAVPLLTLSSPNRGFVFDAGAGAAFMTRQQFGEQDFGGNFQFALTVGIRVPIYQRFGVGYRFQHYSDAGIHGNDTVGADFHMVELRYQF